MPNFYNDRLSVIEDITKTISVCFWWFTGYIAIGALYFFGQIKKNRRRTNADES